MIEKIEGLNTQYAHRAPIGFSGDDVYMIPQGYQGKDVVVKMARRKEVYEEGKNLQWLQSYIRVPIVYQMGKIDEYYFVVMESLPGRMLQDYLTVDTIESIIRLYAKAIRVFHTIPITGIPYNHSLQQKLEDVKRNVTTGSITNQFFEPEFNGLSPEQLYQRLQKEMIVEDDLVLCHGDVCMPNLIVDSQNTVGYIDVVQLGVSDRHLDIAIGLRSLRYNLKQIGKTLTNDYIALFIESYGMSKVSKDKILFYILLDELTKG